MQYVLSCVTHSLSDDPVLSVFFPVGLYPFFHGVNKAVRVLVGGCLTVEYLIGMSSVPSLCGAKLDGTILGKILCVVDDSCRQ